MTLEMWKDARRYLRQLREVYGLSWLALHGYRREIRKHIRSGELGGREMEHLIAIGLDIRNRGNESFFIRQFRAWQSKATENRLRELGLLDWADGNKNRPIPLPESSGPHTGKADNPTPQ